MPLDPRLLRYVIAIAEELHFGRAAARLYVSQPALSEAIKKLEADLGVLLFERGSRHVELTEAGRVFVAQARALLDQSERAVALVRGAARGDVGLFRIGYSPFIDMRSLSLIRSRFPRSEAGIRIEFVSSQTTNQVKRLVEGELQAGLVVLPIADPALTFDVFLREPFTVALPRGHPLEARSEIRLNDIQREPVIWWPRQFNPLFYDRFLTICRGRGYSPNIVQEVTTVHECLHFVAQEEGITFMTRSAHITEFEGVVFRELSEDALFVETGLAYRSDNRSEILRRFAEFVRQQSHTKR